jgi:hypothetical protein
MASTPRSGSSAFDEMMAKTKKELDGLFRGRQPRDAWLARTSAATAAAPAASVTSAPRSDRLDPQSPAVRLLNERFGSNWRYEIAEERRDGDEAIVLCRLMPGRKGAVRLQSGRAKIAAGPLTGASAGVPFKLHSDAPARDEREAFRRATEAALMKCAEIV